MNFANETGLISRGKAISSVGSGGASEGVENDAWGEVWGRFWDCEIGTPESKLLDFAVLFMVEGNGGK